MTAGSSLGVGAERPDVEHYDGPRIAIPLDEAGLALRKAWLVYFVFALIPPAAMIKSIFWLIFTGNDSVSNDYQMFSGAGLVWLIVGMTWVGLTIPIAYVIRGRLWHRYYEGGVVEPDNYLKGWVVVWAPLVVGGVLGFVGLAATHEVSSVFTSLLAFVVFLSLAPNGHALTRPVGGHDDSAVYEEPK